jgi:hypothetical protein
MQELELIQGFRPLFVQIVFNGIRPVLIELLVKNTTALLDFRLAILQFFQQNMNRLLFADTDPFLACLVCLETFLLLMTNTFALRALFMDVVLPERQRTYSTYLLLDSK